MTTSEPDFDCMRGDLMREVEKRRSRRHTRKRLGVIAGVGVVIVATSGAAVIALASQELRQNSAYCYESASTDSRIQQVGDPSPVGDDRISRALDLCASVWRAGILGAEDEFVPPDTGRVYAVPNMFACLQRDDTLAVFPEAAGVSCRDLGLEPPR